MLTLALLLLVAWGALAFGAVYPWAYIPLFAGCAIAGVAMLPAGRGRVDVDRTLARSLAVLLVAILLQLVPLPRRVIEWSTPSTDALLQEHEVGYAVITPAHGLSISPKDTIVGLMAASALAIFLIGVVRGLARNDTRDLIRGIISLGAVLAVAGIVQKALWNGKIYGFWTPIESDQAFGPFVNRNHFAGWMLMATPLATGYFCGRVAQGMRAGTTWRNRLLWFSSQEASETILVGFAIVVMTLSVLLTMSRSGLVGLLGALAICGWFAARPRTTKSRRVAVIIYLVIVAAAVTRWADIDTLASRFTTEDVITLGNRFGTWRDAWRVAMRFPIAGTGLNTYGVSMLYFQSTNHDYHVAQAHNDYLQLLAEGGALVCIPAVLILVVLIHRIRERFRNPSIGPMDYWIRMGAVTGLVAIALQEIGDFSLQMPGNAVLFVILIALAARPAGIDRSSS